MKNKIIKMLSVAGVMFASSSVFGEGGNFTYTHQRNVKDENGNPTRKVETICTVNHSNLLAALESSISEAWEKSTSPALIRQKIKEMKAIIKAAEMRLQDVKVRIKHVRAGIFVDQEYITSPIVESIQKRGSVYDLNTTAAQREKGELEAIIKVAKEFEASLGEW